MAERELTTEEALALLNSGPAVVATPAADVVDAALAPRQSLLNIDSPYKRALGVGAGGLLNLGDALSFGLAGNAAAAGSAMYGDLSSFFTGQPSNTSFELERQKLAELKALARGEQINQGFVVPESVPLIGGAPVVDVAGALKAPIPKAAMVGRGEKLIPALARAIPMSAALGAAPSFSVDMPSEQAIDNAMLGGGISAGAAALFPVVGAAAKATGTAAAKTSKSLMRNALGARVSDYTKTAKNSIIETIDGDFETQAKRSLDNLIEKNTLGTSLDPDVMYSKLQDAKDEVENELQSALAKQKQKVPVPSFDRTIKYISEKVSADDVDRYLAQVERYSDALKREGRGSLTYLNNQKKIVGENWKNSPQSDPGFWRTLYRDMKEHIEKYAPEVKDLNKQKQDLIVAESIVERTKRAAEGSSVISNAMRQLYTTGGAGLAGGALLGTATGDMEAGVIGALGLRALATPKGQQLSGRLLRSLSGPLSGVGAPDGLVASAPMTAIRGSSLVPLLSGLQTPIEQAIAPMTPLAPARRELTTEEALALIK